MKHLSVAGRRIELDKDGYLLALADWSEPVAEALAHREQLQIRKAHV